LSVCSKLASPGKRPSWATEAFSSLRVDQVVPRSSHARAFQFFAGTPGNSRSNHSSKLFFPPEAKTNIHNLYRRSFHGDRDSGTSAPYRRKVRTVATSTRSTSPIAEPRPTACVSIAQATQSTLER
jgi:hypothetical protein